MPNWIKPLGSSWDAWKQAKRTAIEYLAVFIASAGFLFGVLGFVIAAVAAWVAYDANENAAILEIRLNNHMRDHQ